MDHELDLVSLFRDALSQIDGCTVFAITDPNLSLEHFKINQEYYQLVLSDLRMPGLSRIALINKTKEIKPSVTTLLMSAFEVERNYIFQESIANRIINGFLQKPIEIKNLTYEVHTGIDKQQEQITQKSRYR